MTGYDQGVRIERVGRGKCAICGNYIEDGQKVGLRVTVGRMTTVSFVVDEQCATVLAGLLGREAETIP